MSVLLVHWYACGTLLQKRAFVSDYLPLAHNDHTVIGVTWVRPASVYGYNLHAISPLLPSNSVQMIQRLQSKIQLQTRVIVVMLGSQSRRNQ